MTSATSGKAELALPTLAIAEVPVAELPVEDRLLLWENSQLFKFSVQHDATRTSEKRDDAAQHEINDPYAAELWFGNDIGTLRILKNAYIPHLEMKISAGIMSRGHSQLFSSGQLGWNVFYSVINYCC